MTDIVPGDSQQMLALSNRLAAAVRDLRVYFEECCDAIGPASSDDDVRDLWLQYRTVLGMIQQLQTAKAVINEEIDRALIPWFGHRRDATGEWFLEIGDRVLRPTRKKATYPVDAKPERALEAILTKYAYPTAAPGSVQSETARMLAEHLATFCAKNAISRAQFRERVSPELAEELWKDEVVYTHDEAGAKRAKKTMTATAKEYFQAWQREKENASE